MKSNPFTRNPLKTIHIDEKKTKSVLNDPLLEYYQPWSDVGRALYRFLFDGHDMLANMLFDACVYGVDVNEFESFTYYRYLFDRMRALGDEYKNKVAAMEPDTVTTIVAPHEVLATNNVLLELKRCERDYEDSGYSVYSNYANYDDITVFATTLSLETVKRSCYEFCLLINRFSDLFGLQRRICQYYADTGNFYACCKVEGTAYNKPYTIVSYRCNTPLWTLEDTLFDYVKLLQHCLAGDHKHDLDDEYHRLEDDLKARTSILIAEHKESCKTEESNL